MLNVLKAKEERKEKRMAYLEIAGNLENSLHPRKLGFYLNSNGESPRNFKSELIENLKIICLKGDMTGSSGTS